jgi:hypothetical protein
MHYVVFLAAGIHLYKAFPCKIIVIQLSMARPFGETQVDLIVTFLIGNYITLFRDFMHEGVRDVNFGSDGEYKPHYCHAAPPGHWPGYGDS